MPISGACTTLGHLVYPARPPFNFARLVADLDTALAGLDVEDRELGWDHDDVAFLDLGSSRIALSIAEGAPGRVGTIVTVSVGLGPRPGRDTRLAERRDDLAHLIADRIAVRFRPASVIWSETDAVATPDLLDGLHDDLSQRLAAEALRQQSEGGSGAQAPRPARGRGFAQPVEAPRLHDRADRAMTARGGRPRRVANDDQPPDGASLQAAREALYAKTDEARPSATLRLAAHTLNAAIMVVALPVGAAMMTYGLLRGANVRSSARVAALCGIGMGAMDAVGGPDAVAAILRLQL